jgi:hypothetical protein
VTTKRWKRKRVGLLAPQKLLQATWTSPRTSRLLLEAGFQRRYSRCPPRSRKSPSNLGFSVEPNDVTIVESTTGFRYNAPSSYYYANIQNRYVERFAMSYVTGAHTFKTGFQYQQGVNQGQSYINKDLQYTFVRGVPSSITQFASPYTNSTGRRDLWIYVQTVGTRTAWR